MPHISNTLGYPPRETNDAAYFVNSCEANDETQCSALTEATDNDSTRVNPARYLVDYNVLYYRYRFKDGYFVVFVLVRRETPYVEPRRAILHLTETDWALNTRCRLLLKSQHWL